MKFKVLSLFSGCGGLDKGLELSKQIEVVWANDIYEPSCLTFSKNFDLKMTTSDVKKYTIFNGDIGKVDFSMIADSNEIDIITGGPPCQDFSIVRGSEKRKGIQVKRGRLYVHFIRALVTLQPKLFIFENVKGLISANRGNAFKQITEDFKSLKIRWKDIWNNKNGSPGTKKLENYEILFSGVINFSRLGVPQQRERVIIIGLRKDLVNSEKLISDIKKDIHNKLLARGDLLSAFPLTPIEIFEGKPLSELDSLYQDIMMEYKDIFNKHDLNRINGYLLQIINSEKRDIWKDYFNIIGYPLAYDDKIKEEIAKEHESILKEIGYFGKKIEGTLFPDQSNLVLKELDRVKKRMASIPPGGNHEFVIGSEYEVRGLMSNIYRRIHPLKPSPTVIARGGGGTWGYHYKRDRQRLTNRERARLQTFPDNFLFMGNSSEVRRQIGEAVPPLASKKIAEAVLPFLKLFY